MEQHRSRTSMETVRPWMVNGTARGRGACGTRETRAPGSSEQPPAERGMGKRSVRCIFPWAAIAIALNCISCASLPRSIYQQSESSRRVFPRSLSDVRRVASGELSNFNYQGGVVDSAGRVVHLSHGYDALLAADSNQRDILLTGGWVEGTYFVDEDNNPLRYTADFWIHFSSIGHDSTRVTVTSLNAAAQVGQTALRTLPHLVRTARTRSVRPSVQPMNLILDRMALVIAQKE